MENNIKKKGAEFWDNNPCGGAWENYQGFMDYIQRTEPYIFRILDRYEWHNKRVLEVGCGQGPILNYLAQFDMLMHGIDMSKTSLAQAQTGAIEMGHVDRITLSICDAENLSFLDESFDVVISVGVLHHTKDTWRGVREIYRILKPDGVAIVMLYRTGNPKWWATRLLRALSSAFDSIYGKRFFIAEKLSRQQKAGNLQGTALLELFKVPILKAFSNEECCRNFADFNSVQITNHQPGFERNCDIIFVLKPFRSFFRRIDVLMQDKWGFYQVIEASK
jgi:ubiquinone/menaquinone biosynthesis C-methylase UbiE